MSQSHETELVRACRAGDQVACGELIEHYAGKVYAVCLSLLADAHDAEDLAQEALIRGIRRLKTLRDDGQFGPWILRIARNACLDFLRYRQRRKETGYEDMNRFEARESAEFEVLYRAIAALPQLYRDTLLLYYFGGQKVEAVAKSLNCTVATVCTRLSRARVKLREMLEKAEDRT